MKRIAESSGIGIHPSYKTGKEYDLLQKEVTELSSVTNNQIYKSRQHYLRLFVPQTYRNLIKAGIREDYSLGFASLPGFRAGTCTPFVFYDLEIEKQSNLTIIPFQVMDGTLNYNMRLNPDQALVHIKNIIARIKKVNGTFVSIWHNESLSDTEIWRGWKYVFEKMLEMSQNI